MDATTLPKMEVSKEEILGHWINLHRQWIKSHACKITDPNAQSSEKKSPLLNDEQ